VADQFDTSGTWKLERFEPLLECWRAAEHPPDDVFAQVDRWWPSRESWPRRQAHRVPDEDDLWFAWVPGCYLPDLENGLQGVQCLFWVYELGHRVVCERFRTADRSVRDGSDRFDGMG
jgi:hypothetical protein